MVGTDNTPSLFRNTHQNVYTIETIVISLRPFL